MTWGWTLLFSTQVLVGLVDPVGAGRMENVEIDGIFQGLSFVRHVWRDGQHFAGIHDKNLSVDPELQCPVENIGDLFVGVAVFGDDAAFLKQNAGQHDILANDEMALQQRVEVFEFDRAPGNVLESALGARGFCGA